MRNITLFIKHEILTTLGKKSFWIITFIFPFFILALSVGMQTLGTKAIEEAEEKASSIEQASSGLPIGYVDHAKILDTLPEWVPDGYLIALSSQEDANTLLIAGKIKQYYYIPHDFYDTGDIIMIDKTFQPLRSSANAEIFSNIISDVLIEKDPYGLFINRPTASINDHALAPPSGMDEDDPLAYVAPMVTLIIFFFVITSSSSFLLTSITKEKENRMAETLLVSLEPKELMTGKIIGLGVVALLQMTIWLGGAIFALNKSSQFLTVASNFSLPEGFLIWAILFFTAGYFLYGAILATIGVLAPNAREGGQFTIIAIVPLMIPLWFNYTFVESPDGPLSIFLSIFPLTSPPSMITRMTTGNVPIWQPLISLVGLALTAYLFILLSSRLFRADNLLSTDSLTWSRLKKVFKTTR
jgi:ABC-2 type transport system permease protein